MSNESFTLDTKDFERGFALAMKGFQADARDNVTKMGHVAEGTAQAKVPIDEGDLHDSISLTLGRDEKGPYAELRVADGKVWYVEYGTMHRPATPFVRPALRKARSELGKGFKGKGR